MTDAIPQISMTAKPTCRLRWIPKSVLGFDLKLQQAWDIVHYEGKRPVRLETEWRDIPVVTGQQEDST